MWKGGLPAKLMARHAAPNHPKDPSPPMFLHLDCRHYLGDRPCKHDRLCAECPYYEPMGPRVLIVKFGALGDVVRTGCLLQTLAGEPEPPFVTWLTAPAAVPLVRRMPGVHRVLAFGAEALAALDVEQFDLVLSLDKEPAPCGVAMRVKAEQKLGIGLSRYGTAYPLNEECDYYFRLGLDNEEKFHRNRKSLPLLLHEALGYAYDGHPYEMRTTPEDRASAARALEAVGAPSGQDGTLIGINPGAGRVFANKAWRMDGYAWLMHALHERLPGVGFLLLGGSDEAELIDRLAAQAPPARAWKPGVRHDLGTFAGLIERCAVVVSGDTLAMHVALALGRRSVAVFGPTCASEIDMFGLGETIVSPIECSPCYRRFCDKKPNCQDQVTNETVLRAVLRQVEALSVTPGPGAA
jgi:heptosyltransferase-2